MAQACEKRVADVTKNGSTPATQMYSPWFTRVYRIKKAAVSATTQARRRRAEALYRLYKGQSYRTVQNALGCSPTWIRRCLRGHDAAGLRGIHWKPRGRSRKITSQQTRRLRRMAAIRDASGRRVRSLRAIARAMGVSHTTVARELRRHEQTS